jgi:two-component system, NtrC family, sensor kinase
MKSKSIKDKLRNILTGNKLYSRFVRFHSSVYSRVVLIIALLSVFLLGSYIIIFKSVNEKFLMTLIHENGGNIGSIVEGALYHSMLRNDKTELYNTLDLINTLAGIDEVNLYDNTDYLVYSSYSPNATHYNDPDCMNCHSDLNSIFPGEEKTYRIIDLESSCSMHMLENSQRYLLIRNPIMNETSCYTADCHAHEKEDRVLGSLIIKMPLGSFDKAIQESSTNYFLIAALITFLLSSFLVLFTRINIKNPLHALVDASMAVAKGDTNTRLKIKPNQLQDMRMVSLAFNEMLDKLQTANLELENWSKQLEYKVQKKSEELGAVQNELIQIERIASLGKLSASVAHELNNPLSGILIYTKLVHKQLANPEIDDAKRDSMLKKLKLIEGETKRCGDIVKGLLDFSRKDENDHEICHLHEILSGTFELMKHPLKIANVAFNTHFQATNDLIKCSPNQIKQACLAMIVNASEAISPGVQGEILLKTTNPSEETIQIEIIDNGKGIAKENLPHIFEPFFSTKHEASGIGLGLAIVHGIIQNHKGKINIESEIGHGTTFAITFNLIKNKEA